MKKKFLLILVFGIFFISSCYGVLGVTSFEAIEQYGNYTTNLNLTLTTDLADALNATCYYNSSGGNAIDGTELVDGTTINITHFNTTLISISFLADSSSLYGSNISCNVSESDGSSSEQTSINLITLDTSAPTMTFYNVVSGGCYKDTINFNASILDALVVMDTVYFNITNSSGENMTTLLVTENKGNFYSNFSFDTSGYTDGTYNLTVYANDSLGNLNTTSISFIFDKTSPSVATITSSSATTSSLTLTVSISDATGGIGSVCSVDRREAVIIGSTATQTITETGLSCGTSYSYQVTCYDCAGNSVDSSITSFLTSTCSGGGETIGSGSSWTGTTYIVNDEQFEEGYTKEIAVQSRMKVKVGNNYHHVGVKVLTATTATIEIASDPVDVTLDVGEDAKIDVTSDGFYDIYVLLNSIANNKADITVQKIHEEIPEGEGAVETSGEIVGEEGEEEEEPEETNLTWLWIVIGVLVLAGIIGGGIAVKKRGKQ